MLTDKTKKIIRNYSFVELFELYFSKEMKNYIVDCTNQNGYPLTLDDFDTFIGIIILSIINQRKSQKDYWSKNPLLQCIPIASAIKRDKFLEIKSHLKLSTAEDKDSNDKAWKIRKLLEMFRKNCVQFGFFSTALAIDEMMVKFHGRTNLLQFMPNKPDRFGMKLYGVSSPEGYLFDCDIYCGKGSMYYFDDKIKLSKCALGSRVVMLMIQKLLSSVVPRKIIDYHLWFDNFFTSPDLLVHLHNLGLKATGTVRTNRVPVKNILDKEAERGTFVVQHEKNSGINFITVMDSKQVSVLSTAAGVIPLANVQRFSVDECMKVNKPFPLAFKLYNSFMGGVDLHNEHCNNSMPCIRAKKWTWPMFIRFIQMAISNATVLRNLVHDKKVGTKDVILKLAEHYLEVAKKNKLHQIVTVASKQKCERFASCGSRTQKMCKNCNVYSCTPCFSIYHK